MLVGGVQETEKSATADSTTAVTSAAANTTPTVTTSSANATPAVTTAAAFAAPAAAPVQQQDTTAPAVTAAVIQDADVPAPVTPNKLEDGPSAVAHGVSTAVTLGTAVTPAAARSSSPEPPEMVVSTPLWPYASPTRCPVLTSPTILPGPTSCHPAALSLQLRVGHGPGRGRGGGGTGGRGGG